MTSPSRKKRPTTRPSSLLRSERSEVRGQNEGRESRVESRGPDEGRESRVESRGPEGRLAFGFLVVIAVLTIVAPVRAEVVKLKWGNERTPVKKQANTQSALKFVKPGVYSTANQKPDAVIKLTAYESNESLRLASGSEADPTRSVVVNREESGDEFRAAQLPARRAARR